MRLKVTNLGKIKSADIEIKPLTVFVGENNTNKTWTAYALYGLLRGVARFSPRIFPPDDIPPIANDLDAVKAAELKKEKSRVLPQRSSLMEKLGRRFVSSERTCRIVRGESSTYRSTNFNSRRFWPSHH